MKRSFATWRLIDTGPCDGITNMAVDEALLACFDPTTSLPVLRLYGWNPPALSLGRFQERDDVLDLERCAAAGVGIVQRITGGGVIYHTEELTYSVVCAPSHIPITPSIKASFRTLTAFLVAFYRKLGFDARYAVDVCADLHSLGRRTAFCFSGRESYDILIGARKIGGNAQRRQRNVIFQHGSIPLQNCVSVGGAFLREPPAGIGSVTALCDLGIDASVEELKSILCDSFSGTMEVTFVPDVLTEVEKDQVARLVAEKK